MADVRDDFVVRIGIKGCHLRAEIVPEAHHGGEGARVGPAQGRDEAGALLDEGLGGMLPAGLFRAGHGVRADKVDSRRHRRVAEACDLALHAAHVGDERARGQARADRLRQRDDLVDRGGEHDEAGAAHRLLRGVAHLVAPGLGAQPHAVLGPARPEHDAAREAALARGLGHRAAEQTGGQDGELFEHPFHKNPGRRIVEPGAGGPAAGGTSQYCIVMSRLV